MYNGSGYQLDQLPALRLASNQNCLPRTNNPTLPPLRSELLHGSYTLPFCVLDFKTHDKSQICLSSSLAYITLRPILETLSLVTGTKYIMSRQMYQWFSYSINSGASISIGKLTKKCTLHCILICWNMYIFESFSLFKLN